MICAGNCFHWQTSCHLDFGFIKYLLGLAKAYSYFNASPQFGFLWYDHHYLNPSCELSPIEEHF